MHIFLAGGGTGGHVIPNIALIEDLLKSSPKLQITYIGQKNSIEEKLIKPLGVDFKTIPAGKLRRYFSWRNFSDFFKVIGGIFKSYFLIIKLKPNLIFCKGGYVSFPVGVAGFLLGKKIIIHESDVSPGLTTRLLYRMAKKVCLSFEESLRFFPSIPGKYIVTGNPVRASLKNGDQKKGLKILGWNKERPIVLIMGGSSGAKAINELVPDVLAEIASICRVVHICGHGKKIEVQKKYDDSYRQFEYVDEEISHIYKTTDLVVSRAGANTIFEFVALELPSILIPLPSKSSRGDQMENAMLLAKRGACMYLNQEDLDAEKLAGKIKKLLNDNMALEKIKKSLKNYKEEIGDSNEKIISLIFGLSSRTK